MLTSKPKARLFVVGALSSGLELSVDGSRAHYLARVMRIRSGETVSLFNGHDGEWMSRVIETGKNVCRLAVERRMRAQQAELGPWLVFAPIKKAAVDFMAEKATELGASRLCPVFTSRTVVGRINVDRLRANAIEAAQQSERLTVPDVMEPVNLRALFDRWPTDRPLVVLHGRDRAQSIMDHFSATRSASGERRMAAPGFLIGPEGGLTPSELDLAGELPFVSIVEMGPRVLRCETAAMAALACWQAIAGDWRDQRPSPNSGRGEFP